MKKKYIKPKIEIFDMQGEEALCQVYATGPDCPWDNEEGEIWGDGARQNNSSNIWNNEW